MNIQRALASFMHEAGVKLRLPQTTIAFAQTLMHKIMISSPGVPSVHDHSSYILLGQSILFVSTKIMETPMKARDVINVVQRMVYPKEPPMEIGPEYLALKTKMIECEQVVLRQLGFNIHQDYLPYKFLLNYLKSLHAKTSFAQVAWNILNDSFMTPVCLKYTPQVISCAAIYLAATLLNKGSQEQATMLDNGIPELIVNKDSKGNTWWQCFGVNDFGEVMDVCDNIVNLYEDVNASKWREVLLNNK